MKTYTTQEAAELTGSTVRALRKRIERGQLRAVQQGRYWRIPHAELERLGLIGSEGTERGQGTKGTDPPVLHPVPTAGPSLPSLCETASAVGLLSLRARTDVLSCRSSHQRSKPSQSWNPPVETVWET